jgi:hypothetical protein
MLPLPPNTAVTRKDSITSPEERTVGRRSLELPKVTTVEDEAEGPTKTETEQPQQGLTVISMT